MFRKLNRQHCRLILIFAAVLFCCELSIVFLKEKANAEKVLDEKLVEAASIADLYLDGRSLHNQASIEAITQTSEKHWAYRLETLSQALGVTYIYTMVQRNGEIYFVLSNPTPEEVAGELPYEYMFLSRYDEAPEELKQSFAGAISQFSNYDDRWGSFRSHFLPRQSEDGTAYVVGVDIPIQTVAALGASSFFIAARRSLFFIILALPFLLISLKLSTRLWREREQHYLFDELTGLSNKRKLLKDLDDTAYPSLVILNVDQFRKISNGFGLAFGDEVLRAFAYHLSTYRHDDVTSYRCYRLQSDEFAVLAALNLPYEQRLAIFQDFYNYVVSRKFRMPDSSIVSFRVKMGVAWGDEDDLFLRAEMALRKARDTNSSVVPFNEAEDVYRVYRQNLVKMEDVKTALYERRIVPYFHPIVDATSGLIEKHEVLARMVDTEGNIVMMPDEFIPLLKQMRLYNRFTLQLIENAIHQANAVSADISVNISTQDIGSERAFSELVSLVRNSKRPESIHFELLESDSLIELDTLIVAILELKKINCRVGLDDLGKEYSNFDRLMALPIDFVKLDRYVMPNLDRDIEIRNIAEKVIDFAKHKNVATVAEFCSSREICRRARAMGIDFVQGFHLAKPCPRILTEVSTF